MVKCVSCAADVPENSPFCLTCGSPLQPSATSALSSAATEAIVAATAVNLAFDEGRFVPGTLLAGRYRILGLLGKGGMGEVYRANDLRLGQTVALKFLPETMAANPAMLARFYNEVRIARQVTHPNVCRVYDIGEVDGQPFLSMQFIDGENLASLLLRIGRLPVDKAVEITRRLCAGLNAAHPQGVLHRDLKPANIMIDGRGQVFITDFGLAGIAEEIRGPEISSGTPAYMSPEQLAGKAVTAKSDIYALGLVMYEMFTGKPAYRAETLGELIRLRNESRPAEISSVVQDVAPETERIIRKCLDPDPDNRPASALAVSAALPGADHLAAALAAGETPSPEMVAAAGAREAISPRIAIPCFAAIIILLAATVYLNTWEMLVSRINLELPPEALIVQARKTSQQLGYGAPIVDQAFGLEFQNRIRNYVRDHGVRPVNWDSIARSGPPLVTFGYRGSPRPLDPDSLRSLGEVSWNVPPQNVPGMTAVVLDTAGRLVSFTAVPPQFDQSPPPSGSPDPSPLFAAAGLDPKTLTPATPQWTPQFPFDARSAWTGTFPGRPEYPLRVEAAWWRNKPVYFEILGPWNQPAKPGVPPRQQWEQYVWLTLTLIALTLGCAMAWRNLRRGRGDRQGALRLGAFAVLISAASLLLTAHFTTASASMILITAALGSALWIGFELWLGYMALEPTVRHRWPRILVTWTRVVSGHWKDPLVGRDVLIGVLVGLSYSLLFNASSAVARRLGSPPEASTVLNSILGVRHTFSGILFHIRESLLAALLFFFLFFVLRVLLRREWLAAIAFVLLLSVTRGLAASYPIVTVATYLIVYGIVIAMLLRFGLLSLVIAIFVTDMMKAFVFTTDFTAWYGFTSFCVTALVFALSVVAFRNALGGRNVFGTVLDQ